MSNMTLAQGKMEGRCAEWRGKAVPSKGGGRSGLAAWQKSGSLHSPARLSGCSRPVS